MKFKSKPIYVGFLHTCEQNVSFSSLGSVMTVSRYAKDFTPILTVKRKLLCMLLLSSCDIGSCCWPCLNTQNMSSAYHKYSAGLFVYRIQ